MAKLSTEHHLTAHEQQLLNNATELVPYLQKFGSIINEERYILMSVYLFYSGRM